MNGPVRSLGNVCGLLALVLMASLSADRPAATDRAATACLPQTSKAPSRVAGCAQTAPPTAGRVTAAPVGAARFRPVSPGVVTVQPARTEDLEALEKVVVENGGRVIGRCGLKSAPRLKVEVDAAGLARLMAREDVAWLANPKRKVLHNNFAAEILNVTNVWPTSEGDVRSLGLTGRGQFISTSDSGIDTGDMSTIHRDFTNALVGFATVRYLVGWRQYAETLAQDLNGHGTHTAGSLVGDGTMSAGLYKGMAYGAKLWAWFCMSEDGGIYTPDLIDDLFRPPLLIAGVAHIHSASWGGEDYGQYDEDSQDIDAYCWANPDFLPVFSAGNEYDEMTICPEAGAKNALAVGASETTRSGRNPNLVCDFSSKGPMSDGRIKPDVVSPGDYIYSTRSSLCGASTSGDYRFMSGTSMACPLTAGAAALVREWLVDHRGFATPSAALLKAVLMGGADDLFGKSGTNVKSAAPNATEGWGRVNVGASVAPDGGRAVYLADYIPFHAGSNVTFTVTTTNAAPLDVQLVWIDYPGKLYPSTTRSVLVNDLDLRVRSATGEQWLGNGGTSPDRLNNVESVRLKSASAGTYEVRVSGFNVPQPSERGGAAAVYVRGAFDPEAVGVMTAKTEAVTLTIGSSSPGNRSASPVCGTYSYAEGTQVTVRADDYSVVFGPQGNASVRYPFVGFSGTGSVPTRGTTNSVAFTIMEDSTIDWRWDEARPEYRYRTFLRLYGYADNVYTRMRKLHVEYDRYYDVPYQLKDEWVATNAQFSVKLPEDIAYDPFTRTGYHSTDDWRTYSRGNWSYRFAQAFYCRTDEDLVPLYDDYTGHPWPEVEITMDEGCDIVLDYYEQNDTFADWGIQAWAPTWWILRNMWWYDFEGGLDCSAAGDPDGDGFSNQDEYRVDTDPLDWMSRLAMTGVSATNVVWIGGREVPQVLERSDSLVRPVWTPVFTNLTEETEFWYNTKNTNSNGFYRINVPKGLQR